MANRVPAISLSDEHELMATTTSALDGAGSNGEYRDTQPQPQLFRVECSRPCSSARRTSSLRSAGRSSDLRFPPRNVDYSSSPPYIFSSSPAASSLPRLVLPHLPQLSFGQALYDHLPSVRPGILPNDSAINGADTPIASSDPSKLHLLDGAFGFPMHDSSQQSKEESSSEDNSAASQPGQRRPGPSARKGDTQSQPSSTRRSGSRQNFPPAQYYSQSITPRDGYQPSPSGVQQYSSHYPPAQAPGIYTQRPGYMGQYTVSQQPHPPALQSSPGFAYPPHTFPHPGRPDSNIMQQPMLNPYSSTQMAPSIHASSPIYPYHQQPSPDSHGPSFVDPSSEPPTSSTSTPPIHTSVPTSSGTLFQPGPYPGSSNVPHFAYPPHSFSQSTPSLYTSSYPQNPYSQAYYTPQASEEVKGTWWYLPASVPSSSSHYEPPQVPYPNPPYQMGYSVPQFDPYHGVSSPSSSMFSTSPTQRIPHSPASAPAPETSRLRAPAAPAASSAGSNPAVPRILSDEKSAGSPPPSSPARSGHKSYRPNPPAHRSEWVMWVGNVPSDATHDELWRFFNQSNSSALPSLLPSNLLSSPDDDVWGGVSSVFLISRSNCAFVNFESQNHLECAVNHFNGQPLRPNDPKCPRLVCRVRRRDDDLKAGVGGQRGLGMHTRWVREQKGKGKFVDTSDDAAEDTSEPPVSAGSQPGPSIGSHDSASREDDSSQSGPKNTGSSDSYASTTSSFLARYLPQRYFILKSLTQFDLNLSVERGMWATQIHNEPVLDQAYRTSQDVFLIFGANKTGEFFGYARMAGPVSRSESVPWASRSDAPTSPRLTGRFPPTLEHALAHRRKPIAVVMNLGHRQCRCRQPAGANRGLPVAKDPLRPLEALPMTTVSADEIPGRKRRPKENFHLATRQNQNPGEKQGRTHGASLSKLNGFEPPNFHSFALGIYEIRGITTARSKFLAMAPR
ncbi:hypothetical protein SISSUDRAFT_36069 [Sistotremastrum suecicum HHB10207 ss-3]|uniref:YTH domain-containing protein n=1 Tax=Sistotremastrum suecicum HHB10207 ss-3 TaxID=1314776 RepID=A0A166JD94_9AGAM|nr:hypothetical protein SISSUDRAFT_36069 [Sistotremastrum suecicum HHB10207 ss-3]